MFVANPADMNSNKKVEVKLRQLGMVAGTRALGGIGLGLLLSSRLSDDRRKAVGWSLFSFGLLTTIPLVRAIILGAHPPEKEASAPEAAPIETAPKPAVEAPAPPAPAPMPDEPAVPDPDEPKF